MSAAPEDPPAKVLAAYGPLVITARPHGVVALDFTTNGAAGPFVTLTATQWRALYFAAASAKRPS